MLWVTMVVLVVVLFVADLVASQSTPMSTIFPGMRAVIVPTADSARTVVVPPCGTGATISTNPTVTMNTPGAVSILLPQGLGNRVVLVPKCTTSPGSAAVGTSFLPSGAFVTKPGTPLPPLGGSTSTSSSSSSSSSSASSELASPNSAQLLLSLPPGSPIRTIVVAPCESTPRGPSEQILSAGAGSTTAVAPSC